MRNEVIEGEIVNAGSERGSDPYRYEKVSKVVAENICEEVLNFKSQWCPHKSHHDWVHCKYAHTYQDFRRSPLMGYGPKPCPHWASSQDSRDYWKRCPYNFRCPYSHGPKENLYHPTNYKVHPCAGFRQGKECNRFDICAFYHGQDERRVSEAWHGDYSEALPRESLQKLKQVEPKYMTQPFFVRDPADFEPLSRKEKTRVRRREARRRKAALRCAQRSEDEANVIVKEESEPHPPLLNPLPSSPPRPQEEALASPQVKPLETELSKRSQRKSFNWEAETARALCVLRMPSSGLAQHSGRRTFCVDDLWPRLHFNCSSLQKSRRLLFLLGAHWTASGSRLVYVAAHRGYVSRESCPFLLASLDLPPRGFIQGPALLVLLHPSGPREADLTQLFSGVRRVLVVVIHSNFPLPSRLPLAGEPPALIRDQNGSLPTSDPYSSGTKNLSIITPSRDSRDLLGRALGAPSFGPGAVSSSQGSKKKTTWNVSSWRPIFPTDELNLFSWARSFACPEVLCEYSGGQSGLKFKVQEVDPCQTGQALAEMQRMLPDNLAAWRDDPEVRPFKSNVKELTERAGKETDSQMSSLDRARARDCSDMTRSEGDRAKFLALLVGQDSAEEPPFCQWWVLSKRKFFPTSFFSLTRQGAVPKEEKELYEARLRTLLECGLTLPQLLTVPPSSSSDALERSDWLPCEEPIPLSKTALLRKVFLLAQAALSAAPSFLLCPSDVFVDKASSAMAVVIPENWMGGDPARFEDPNCLLQLLALYVFSDGLLDHLPRQNRKAFSLETLEAEGAWPRGRARKESWLRAKGDSHGSGSGQNLSVTKDSSKAVKEGGSGQGKDSNPWKECPPVFDEALECLEKAVKTSRESGQLRTLLKLQPLLENLLTTPSDPYQKLVHPFFWSPRVQLSFLREAVRLKAARREKLEKACAGWRESDLALATVGMLKLLHCSEGREYSDSSFMGWLDALEFCWIRLCQLTLNSGFPLSPGRLSARLDRRLEETLMWQLNSLAPSLFLELFLDVRTDLEGNCRYFFEKPELGHVRRAFDCDDIFGM